MTRLTHQVHAEEGELFSETQFRQAIAKQAEVYVGNGMTTGWITGVQVSADRRSAQVTMDLDQIGEVVVEGPWDAGTYYIKPAAVDQGS